MVRIVTVTIHHPQLGTESEVPPATVAGWARRGWVEGPLPAPKTRASDTTVDRHNDDPETSPVGETPTTPKEGQP